MARKGPKILLAVLIVVLVYLLAIIVVTQPGYNEKVQKKISEKTGVAVQSAPSAPSATDDQIRALISEEVSKQLALSSVPEVDTEAIASEAASKIDIDSIERKSVV